MALGRLGGSPIVSRVDPERLLIVAFGVTLVGFFIAWLATSAAPMLVGFFIAGTGMGLHWPLGISRALRASGGRTDRGSAMASVGAGMASGAAPFALGALADALGVHEAFLIVPALILVATAVVLLRPVPLSLAEPAETPSS
jgi:fucose permease